MLPPDQLVSLFWSLLPDEQDYENLRLSGVRRMSMVAPVASQDILRRMRDGYGVRGVALRLHDYDYDNAHQRALWADTFEALMPLGVDTCVLGVEVDERFDQRFGSRTWGEYRAEELRDEILKLLEEWAPLIERGLRIVSPALMYRGHYRDWREGLQPGSNRWWEIMRPAHNACSANACHVYGADGTWYDTRERVKTGLWLAQSLANRPVWLGEVNIDRGTDVEQMVWLCRLLTLLYWRDAAHPEWGPWAGSGERLLQFVPFSANGDGVGWGSPNHLIRDPNAYRVLGQFMAGTRFYF